MRKKTVKVKQLTKASDPTKLHKVYSAMLATLDLTVEHCKALNSRGLTDQEVATLGYKSFPLRRREIAERLSKRFNLHGVPGFWREPRSQSWDIAGKTGLAIPVRSRDGHISGIKLRVDKPARPSAKYILLSSNPGGEKGYPGGTKAHISIHWPLHRGKVKAVRITEGEMKADVATSMMDEYTISLPGVNSWRMALDPLRELKPQMVMLAFDADKTEEKSGYTDEEGNEVEPYTVGKALAGLYLSLKSDGFNVVIEDWPPEAGKGIDDVILNGAQDRISRLTGEQADSFAEEILRGGLPQGWVYVVGVKQFFNTQSLLALDKEQFNDQFAREINGSPANTVLRNAAFPLYDFPIYAPRQPVSFVKGVTRYFNLWRPQLTIKSEPKVKPKPFLEHVAYMIPNVDEQRAFLDWLAWNIQRPGEKILWAMLLQSAPGVGKSYFGDIMRVLLGERNVSSPSNDDIHETFTGWAKNCSLVIIEELMARGRLELMNRLKPMITQPLITVREMYRPPYSQPNCFNLLMFTNHENAVTPGRDDRRYCIIYSKAPQRPVKYYEALWGWTRAHYGSILSLLMERDLKQFNPLSNAPHTSWKEELIRTSTPLLQWMNEKIELAEWPFQSDVVSVMHLSECLPRSIRGNYYINQIGDALKELKCKPLERGAIKLETGGQVKLWTVRRHEIWNGADSSTLRTEYEKWSMSHEPGNPLLDAKPL
jgi:hypothetical protein